MVYQLKETMECFICRAEYEHGLRRKEDITQIDIHETLSQFLHDKKEHPAIGEIALEG